VVVVVVAVVAVGGDEARAGTVTVVIWNVDDRL
jgi:hypothetical protein